MTGSAWAMMITTWSVIAFFTVRFFVLVVRKPAGDHDERS